MGNVHNPPSISSCDDGTITFGTAYVRIPLTKDASVDGSRLPAKRMHAGVFNVALDGAGTSTTATVKFTRDSAGDHLIAGPSAALTLEAAQSTANRKGATVAINAPLFTDGDTVHAWLKVDAGTPTLVRADLTWVE